MTERSVSLAIIGGGVGGMAAAVAAYDAGIRDIVILEASPRLGGVLGQCIHAGFGLHTFGEELTGPEYSARFEKLVAERGIEVWTSSPVLSVTADRRIEVFSSKQGSCMLLCGAIVLASGCRERPAGALTMEGTRPAGVLTAGTAQKYINLEGYMVGKRAVILGSGDIGLIMARRLTLEGAKVLYVCELMPYSNGLNRNIVQCLRDYDIPLRLSTTVVGLEGRDRLTGVWLAPVDPQTLEVRRSEKQLLECDTLLLSVGLIPETGLLTDAGASLGRNNGISVDEHRCSDIPGIFACGNVVQVHDLVDFVAEEGRTAGAAAAEYLRGETRISSETLLTSAGNGIGYVVPERISLPAGKTELCFRVKNVFRGARLRCTADGRELLTKKRPVMLPGEMEKLTLDLTGVSARELKVEVLTND